MKYSKSLKCMNREELSIYNKLVHDIRERERERNDLNKENKIILKILKYFESTMLMQNARRGFFNPKQNRARSGWSGFSLAPRRCGRFWPPLPGGGGALLELFPTAFPGV